MPLMFLVPATVLDFNMYTAVHGQLQNSLDSAAQAALSQSTADDYRADKELYIITRTDDINNYINKLKTNIDANFHTSSSIVQTTQITSNGHNYYQTCVLAFTPGFETTPTQSTLTVKFVTSSSLYNGQLLQNGDAKGTAIELTLNSHTTLPFLSKIMGIFNISRNTNNSIDVNAVSNISGIRVKTPDDFNIRNWQNY